MRRAGAVLAAAALVWACAQQPVLTPESPLLGAPLSTRAENEDARQKIAEFEQKGDWQGLSGLAAGEIAREPANTDWQLVLGYARLHAEDYAKAIEVLRQVAERTPEDVDARNLQGEALRLSGQPDSAIQVLERSVLARPNSVAGWFLLGEAYRDTQRLERARHAYSEAVRINPEYGLGWYGLAAVLGRVGPKDEYEEALKKLQTLSPALYQQHLKLRTPRGA